MRYQLSFKFFENMEGAENFKNTILKNANSYYKKHKKITITPWQSSDGAENKIILWYYI